MFHVEIPVYNLEAFPLLPRDNPAYAHMFLIAAILLATKQADVVYRRYAMVHTQGK